MEGNIMPLSNDELNSAHRIFNYVDSLVDYYGHKTLDGVARLISENRWIMFPVFNITSITEGKTYPTPNIFFSFEDRFIISDDGNGRPEADYLGLTCHNDGAMIWLNNTLRHERLAQTLILNIQGLGDTWNIYVTQKVKTSYKDNVPKYKTLFHEKPSTVTIPWIQQSIRASDNQLLRRGEIYDDEPVLWSKTVFTIMKKFNTESFDEDIVDLFNTFKGFLN